MFVCSLDFVNGLNGFFFNFLDGKGVAQRSNYYWVLVAIRITIPNPGLFSGYIIIAGHLCEVRCTSQMASLFLAEV